MSIRQFVCPAHVCQKHSIVIFPAQRAFREQSDCVVPVPSNLKFFVIPVSSLEVPHLHVGAPDPRPVTILPEHCGPRGQAGVVTRNCVVISRAVTPGVIIVKL